MRDCLPYTARQYNRHSRIVPGFPGLALAPCLKGRLPDGHRAKSLASLTILSFNCYVAITPRTSSDTAQA